jgi:hypothetical protein
MSKAIGADSTNTTWYHRDRAIRNVKFSADDLRGFILALQHLPPRFTIDVAHYPPALLSTDRSLLFCQLCPEVLVDE